jgi:hypothetical protein
MQAILPEFIDYPQHLHALRPNDPRLRKRPICHCIPAAHPVKAREAASVSVPALTVTGSVRRLDGVQFGVPALLGINAWALTLHATLPLAGGA